MAWRAAMHRLALLWRRDPKGMSIDLLRVGIGAVWALNLIFILAPSNEYFPMFQSMASSFGATTLGGPGFADLVASYPVFFAWTIALVTAYLAVAFLAGVTTRLACAVGAAASLAFLLTQWYQTFDLTGNGTDVGSHPLYLLIYLILFTAGAGQYFALDHWVWSSGRARLPRLSRWIASPRDLPCNANCPAAGIPRPDAPGIAAPARAPSGSPDRRSRAVLALVAVMITSIAIAGAFALHASPPGAGATPSPTRAMIQDIRLVIEYPGNATSGGFGASMQDGCWKCSYALAPGGDVVEEEMLTNGPGGSPLTVTGLTVHSPFGLTAEPTFPKVVGPGQMFMFDIGLQAPASPGNYVATLTVTVE